MKKFKLLILILSINTVMFAESYDCVIEASFQNDDFVYKYTVPTVTASSEEEAIEIIKTEKMQLIVSIKAMTKEINAIKCKEVK